MSTSTLAKTPPEPPAQYLTFGLDGATLALPILRVSEIIEMPAVTPVPLTPDFVRGVLNLRGAVVPVVDLKARFGRGPATVGRKTCVVIVELRPPGDAAGEPQAIGVMVDQVNEVIELPAAEIEPPPAFGAGVRSDFIQGMGRRGGRFVLLLAIDNLLCIEELAAAAAAGAALEVAGAGT